MQEEKLIVESAPAPILGGEITGEDFQLDMVDFGSTYQPVADAIPGCFRCYCGGGCLCGCVNE